MRRVSAVLFAASLWSGGVDADPAATRSLNDFRTANGRAAIAYSTLLEIAAMQHARDMAANSLFSHTGSNGSDVGARVSQAGYSWCVVAENIAQGQRDLGEVMQAWADSEGHRRNMLSAEVTEFALVQVAGNIWVMVLAAPGC